MVGGTNLPPTIQTSVNFSNFEGGSDIFTHLRRVTFKFGSFTNIKPLFPVVTKDFP